jgi:hypothetical protein
MKDALGNFIGEVVVATLIFILGILVISYMLKITNITIPAQISKINKNIIIVDRGLSIEKIILVNKKNTIPLVLLDNENGLELPYTTSIQEQYATIKPLFLFFRVGVIYDNGKGISAHINKIYNFSVLSILKTFQKH